MESINGVSDILNEEQLLMSEWEKRWKECHIEYSYFNQDGIVSYEKWSQLPEGKHILVILKETDALEGSLAEFFGMGAVIPIIVPGTM